LCVCVLFPLFLGDCDSSGVEVMEGGLVAIDLRWMVASDLRWSCGGGCDGSESEVMWWCGGEVLK
ncbi:hypothetical protein L195_g061349, partial [Trifolium pratense]